jgi:uncharacterized membrane protein
MDVEPWLHFFHIGGAIVWVGGGVMLSIFGARAQRAGNLVVIGEFAGMLSYVGLRIFMPAVVVVLVTGVWIVVVQSREFTDLWVVLALVAFAAAFLIGAIYLSRNAIALDRAVKGSTPDSTAVSEILGRWIVGYWVVLAILVFAVWDMVFKPGT